MSDIVSALNAAPQIVGALGLTGGAGYTLTKIVGPSMSAIGNVLGEATEYRVRNWLNITAKAERRLAALPESEREDERASVHPRVAQAVLEEGSWVDDALLQEYLAGLLVSARSAESPSDDAAYFARIVAGLTSQQCRLHYAMISAYEGYWKNPLTEECEFPFPSPEKYRQHAVTFDTDESGRLFPEFDSSALGLQREEILGNFGLLEDKSRTCLVPTPLAFRIYRHALASHPAQTEDESLMLTRDRLQALSRQPGGEKYTFVWPDPEPSRFRTHRIESV